MSDRTYIAIDLKSFYASVEYMDRQLDPMTTNLVVADESRTEKTICLAVSPSLKKHGIPGRARLFEVIQRVQAVNADRRHRAPRRQFSGKSANVPELQANPALELDYIVAVPRMGRYMEVSAKIYSVYLKYVSPDDIHVYSIDEVFIDATSYLKLYKLTAREFAMKMIRDVLQTTGITATAGIGSNMYLCKIAMDIEAKHIQADKDGVRIAELTERSYREKMWSHRPLTDFWRVGKGYASKLESAGMYTMGDIARMSVKDHDYRDFYRGLRLIMLPHKFSWGDYGHRIFFHWGFNIDPRKSESLQRQFDLATSDPEIKERGFQYIIYVGSRTNSFWNSHLEKINDSAPEHLKLEFPAAVKGQAARNRDMIQAVGRLSPGKRDHHNAVATILYNTHILGDYVEGKAHTQAAMQPLKGVIADTIEHGVSNFDCPYQLREDFKKEVWKAYKSSGAVKNKAEAVLEVMKKHIPKCVANSRVIKRIVWGDMKPSSIASENKPQTTKK